MGKEVGGGFRMGNTCTPMADSCQCMAKTSKKGSDKSRDLRIETWLALSKSTGSFLSSLVVMWA